MTETGWSPRGAWVYSAWDTDGTRPKRRGNLPAPAMARLPSAGRGRCVGSAMAEAGVYVSDDVLANHQAFLELVKAIQWETEPEPAIPFFPT